MAGFPRERELLVWYHDRIENDNDDENESDWKAGRLRAERCTVNRERTGREIHHSG
jgi:hypothetical protein